ncbi:MAG: hypothetical protein E7547_07805 [Ruminococcaceae bacterium]|nr:hypothetical protein [Oscillospiraceae bacterium]
MENKDLIGEVEISVRIYDSKFSSKVAAAVSKAKTEWSINTYCKVKILFDTSIYENPAFYKAKLDKKFFNKNMKIENNKIKKSDFIYVLLDQQLNKTVEALKEAGIPISEASIIGDTIDNKDMVKISLLKDEEFTNNPDPTFKLLSVMPDRQYLADRAAQALAPLILKLMREQTYQEECRKDGMRKTAKAECLFKSIVDNTDLSLSVTEMLSSANLLSMWPLIIEHKNKEGTIQKHTVIDIPEYIVFIKSKGSQWSIRELVDLKEAEKIITKQGYNFKGTEFILVLKDLQPMPFSLMKAENGCFSYISKEDAVSQKNLLVCWEK